jgi:Cu+-exporting ATPase
VPVDGVITEGRSSLDESMVTGESMPVTREVGGNVIGGTLNVSGGFVMRAEKIGSETMLARIVQMVANAQRSRAPIQRLADQVSGWFVPAVIAFQYRLCRMVAVGPEPRFAHGLVAAVAFSSLRALALSGWQRPCRSWSALAAGLKPAFSSEMRKRWSDGDDTIIVDKTGTPQKASLGHIDPTVKGQMKRNCSRWPHQLRRRASIRWLRQL